MTNIFTIKVISIITIFLVTLIAGIYPFFKKRRLGNGSDFPIGQALASGVFLGAGLIHMLADASDEFDKLNIHYPLAFLLAGISFLLLLLLEHWAQDIGEHKGENSSAFAYIAVLMLSVHSLLEGTALGIGSTFSLVIILFIAIIAHKWAESFALAVQINKSAIRFNLGLLLFFTFIFMTPIGILSGALITSTLNTTPLLAPIFNSLAAGTFLYLGTVHGLARSFMIEKCCNHKHFTFVIIGFTIMAIVAIWA